MSKSLPILPSIIRKNNNHQPKEDLAEHLLVPLLARRSCHLPGNDWWQDWRQWFGNNHIVFGICLHHPYHPVESWERWLALVASVAYGFLATFGIVYYWDVVVASRNNNDEGDDGTIDYEYYQESTTTSRQDEVLWEQGGFVLTRRMLILWTFGSLLHSILDNVVIWRIMACACCEPGGRFACLGKYCCPCCGDVGTYLLIPIILGLLGAALYMVLLRASHSDQISKDDQTYYNLADDHIAAVQAEVDNNADDDAWRVEMDNIHGLESFGFLMDYLVELILAWFVYFPIMGTIIFSGVLGCGRLPILGGRPKDVRLVQQDDQLARYDRM